MRPTKPIKSPAKFASMNWVEDFVGRSICFGFWLEARSLWPDENDEFRLVRERFVDPFNEPVASGFEIS